MTIYLTTQQIQEILNDPLYFEGVKFILSDDPFVMMTDHTCEIGITKESLSMLEESGMYVGDGFTIKLKEG